MATADSVKLIIYAWDTPFSCRYGWDIELPIQTWNWWCWRKLDREVSNLSASTDEGFREFWNIMCHKLFLDQKTWRQCCCMIKAFWLCCSSCTMPSGIEWWWWKLHWTLERRPSHRPRPVVRHLTGCEARSSSKDGVNTGARVLAWPTDDRHSAWYTYITSGLQDSFWPCHAAIL